jgi:TP901 family phage tail tape measure protein
MAMNLSQTAVLEMIIKAEDRASATLHAASRDVEGLGASMARLGRTAMVAGAALSGVAVGIVGAMGGLVKSAGDFEELTTALVTGAGESAANLESVRSGLLAMAGTVGVAANDLAKGMYMIESAGFHGAAGLQVLQASAQGARVGMADQAVVADALTTILKDYHLAATDAAGVTGQMIATVASGKMHMDDFAGSLSKVLPTAAGLGISFTQVGAAMATLTARGVPADTAANALRFALTALVHPTNAAQKAFKDLGMDYRAMQDQLSAGNLTGVLTMFQAAIDQATARGLSKAHILGAEAAIFGGARGTTVATNLLPNLDEYTANLGKIGGLTAGQTALARAWDDAQGDLNTRIDQFRNGLDATGKAIGLALLPQAKALLSAITALFGPLQTWIRAHTDLIARVLPLAAALTGLTGTLLLLGGAALIIGAALNPVTLALGAVAAAVAVLGGAWLAGMGDLQRTTRTTGDLLGVEVARWATTLGGWASGAWTAMQPALSTIGTHITTWLNTTADSVKAGTQRWAQNLVGGLHVSQGSMDTALQSITDGMDAWVKGDGVNAAIRLGNNLADAIVAAIVAKFNATLGAPSWWAGLLKIGTTTAPFQPTGGGLLGAIAPDITQHMTAPFAPGGALYNATAPTTPSIGVLPGATGVSGATGPGAPIVPWQTQVRQPTAPTTTTTGAPDTGQTWAPSPNVAPAAFASIGREVALMEGAVGRMAQQTAQATARTALPASSTVAMEMAGGGVVARQMPTQTTPGGTGGTQAGGTQGSLAGLGSTTAVNISVSVGSGAVQVSGGTQGADEARWRDFAQKVGEGYADLVATLAKAERMVSTPGRPSLGGSRG